MLQLECCAKLQRYFQPSTHRAPIYTYCNASISTVNNVVFDERHSSISSACVSRLLRPLLTCCHEVNLTGSRIGLSAVEDVCLRPIDNIAALHTQTKVRFGIYEYGSRRYRLLHLTPYFFFIPKIPYVFLVIKDSPEYIMYLLCYSKASVLPFLKHNSVARAEFI